jgi:hypothetical protein
MREISIWSVVARSRGRTSPLGRAYFGQIGHESGLRDSGPHPVNVSSKVYLPIAQRGSLMNTTTSLPKKRRSSNVEDRRPSKRRSRKRSGQRETPELPSSPSLVDKRTEKCTASKRRSRKPSGGRETPELPSSPSWVDKQADKCTGDHSLPPSSWLLSIFL